MAATLAAVLAPAALSPCAAQSHLKPEDSVLGGSVISTGYDEMVADAFHEAFGPTVRLRVIFEPSFYPENAVFLTSVNDDYRIVTLTEAKPLWDYQSLAMMKTGAVQRVDDGDAAHGVKPDKEIAEFEASMPKDFHDLKIARCEAPLDAALARRLIAAWKPVLLETRFDQPGDQDVVATDGVSGHFADLSGYPALAGWTNWAPEGSKPLLLWNLALTMSDYCGTPDGNGPRQAGPGRRRFGSTAQEGWRKMKARLARCAALAALTVIASSPACAYDHLVPEGRTDRRLRDCANL